MGRTLSEDYQMRELINMLSEAILVALGIFALRVVNNAIGTIRLVVLTRDRRGLAALFGFLESLTFAVSLGVVVNNLTDVINMIAYCGGFSVGGYIGQIIEARFISSFVTVNVITSEKGRDIAAALRDKGYGVTEILGEGGAGVVTVLRSVVARQQVGKVLKAVNDVDIQSFVTVEEARAIHRGWIRAARNQQ
jgi:uncharacterized protein YebE (UPF0316 family)